MDAHGISATALAEAMGISKNAISNLRSSEMPRIGGDRLNSLILALNRLRRPSSPLIAIDDLIQFSITPKEMAVLGIKV